MTEAELQAQQAGKANKRTAKETKQQADQALDLDLELTSKFETGRQMAIAEGRAVLAGYHQGKLEVAQFIKQEILSSPASLKSASYERLALPPECSQSSIRALFYGEDDA
jgi:hypothetical protein